MFWRKRIRPPISVSLQTPNAVPVGALSYAYWTPYRTPAPLLGTGVPVGSYIQEQGRTYYQPPVTYLYGLGGVFTGVFAQQPLSDPDYVLSRPVE